MCMFVSKTLYSVNKIDMKYIVTFPPSKETWEFYDDREANDFIDSFSREIGEDKNLFTVDEVIPCRGNECDKHDTCERLDAYGISTGYWCDDCYENNYPYRKDWYDFAGNGERLDDDY